MDGTLEREALRERPSVSKVEALDLQNLRVKDPETLQRVLLAMPIAEAYFGESLGEDNIGKLRKVVDLNEVTQNNLTFLVRAPDGRQAIIKLGSDESFKSEHERLDFLNRHFPTDPENGDVFFPKLIGVNEEARALVTTFEDNKLKKDGSGKYASLFLRGLQEYSKIPPTPENIEKFPPQVDPGKMNPESYLEFAEQRLQGFYDWLQKLKNSFGTEEERKNGLKMRREERADYLELLKEFEKNGIEEIITKRLESARALVKRTGPDFQTLSREDLRLCPTDLKVENTSFTENTKGEPAIELFDMESLRFGDMDLAVAKFVQFPTTLEAFKDHPELLNNLIQNYAREQKDPEKTLERLSVLMEISNFDLLAGVLRRFPAGPNNYREVYAGKYPTVASALLQVNLPWLVDYLNNPVPTISGNIEPAGTPDYDKMPENSICPLTGKPPVGKYEEWLTHAVPDGDTLLNEVNTPLAEVNAAFPFKREELAGKRPILIGKTESVTQVGDGVYLVVNSCRSFNSPEGTPFTYGYLTPDKMRYERENGLIVTIGNSVDLENTIETHFKSQKAVPFSIEPDLIASTFEHSQDPKRSKFFASQLTKLPNPGENPGADEITNIELIETVHPFFTVAKVETKSGKVFPLKINRVGSDYTTGVGFVLKSNDEIVPILNTRPLTPEIGSGDQGVISTEELELIRAFGDRELLESLSRKLNLRPHKFDIETSRVFRLRSDPALEFVYTRFNTANIVSGSGKQWGPEDKPQSFSVDEYRTYPLTPTECLQAVAENKTRDPFTIAGIATEMIMNGDLVLADEAKGQSILMEKLFRVQGGNVARLEIPRGKVSAGDMSGEILPNSGNTRDKLSVRTTNAQDFAGAFENRSMEIVSIKLEEVINLIKNQQLDIITISAIVSTLIKQRLMVQKT